MKRRTVILGLGGVAGGGVTLGTGAFTSTTANRDVSVAVAEDSDAYLGVSPSPSDNGVFATTDGGEIVLDFSNISGGGAGVGTNSTYRFDDVFRVTNRGTQTIYVWATFDGASGDEFDVGTSDPDIYLYPDGDPDEMLRDNDSEVLGLTPGGTSQIGVHIDTDSVDENQELSMTLYADVERPGDSDAVDEDGEDFVVVDQSGDGDYTTIQGAIDDVDGTTVVVNSGTYQEDVVVDVDGLTLRGTGGSRPVIKSTGTDDYGVQAPLEVSAENVEIEGFEIEGTSGGSQKHGIHVSSGPNVLLEDVRVNQLSGYDKDEFNIGIAVNNVPDVTVRNAEVNGKSDMDRGIRFYPAPNSTIRNCTVNDCDRAIDVAGGNITVEDSEVNGITADSPDGWYKDPDDNGLDDESFPDGKGIRVESQAFGDTKSDNEILNNAVNSCATGIELDGSDSEIAGNEITDCSTGISVSASTHTIADNTITGGSGRGISVFSISSGDEHHIENNTISDHGLGIVLSGSDDNTLVGNTITDATYNGIWLNDGNGSATGNVIEDNTVSNNGFGSGSAYPAVYLGSAEETEIRTNEINANAAQGIAVVGSSGTVIESNTLEDNGAGTGDYIYSGMYLSSVTDTEITDNELVKNYYRGIWVDGYTEPLTIEGNDIELRYPDYYQKIVTEQPEQTSSLSTATVSTNDSDSDPVSAPGGISP